LSVDEIARIIAKDTGSTGAMARRMAERVTSLHKELDATVAGYLNGESVSFSFGDITLETIIEKENCSLIEAIFSMSTLLDRPELADRYKSLPFRRGDLEG
jgi:hypothetical protein